MSASRHTVKLVDNATLNGGGTAMEWVGGEGEFSVGATFGGATIKLQAQVADASTWVDVGTDVTFTASGIACFKLAAGTMIRAYSSASVANCYAHATRIG